ncbi:hypothetical protein RRG08_025078 [Elysia crispata]|uniref:Uncharacterized protein n=1 Tax=Elysia crispata TaxID=231223 RepID=A0AAE1AJL4_9GAST|nr:hypothetical protein RRG08_025078 [Elysia crispata]
MRSEFRTVIIEAVHHRVLSTPVSDQETSLNVLEIKRESVGGRNQLLSFLSSFVMF